MRKALVTIVAAATLVALGGCSSDAVRQATDLGSSVASGVAEGVQGIDGDAIRQGMANVAGGIDGALDAALSGAGVTSDGELPDGFPTKAVPLVDGTVLGGGAGPNGTGWVAQIRASSVDDFAGAAQELTDAGFTASAQRSDGSSAFGLFRSDGYRVVLTFAKGDQGATATYIVTPR